jgi:hypothetical protein
VVRLYTWNPPTPAEVLKGETLPDAGHCAVEVTDDVTGEVACYASFWPEEGSLLARLARPFGERPARHPQSLADECSAALPYMRRPPDHTDELPGLRGAAITAAWERLKDSPYDLRRWNCSSVAKYLLVRAMPASVYEQIRDAEHCTPEDLAQIADEGGLAEALASLPLLLIECRPADAHRLAEAYRGWALEPQVAPAT